jgi:hypothetical protein
MKKALLVLGAVAMVFSGVAAVSAYEAHTVNVSARVENAMSISKPDDWHLGQFGTVFPEEFIWKEFDVRLSTSFCVQLRVRKIHYKICVKERFNPMTGTNFPWMGDAMAFSIDGQSGLGDGEEWAWVGNAWPPPICVTGDSINKQDLLPPYHPDNPAGPPWDPINWQDDPRDTIRIGLDVPVFREYYNEFSDNKPKPSGKDVPSVIYEPGDPRYDPYPDGVDDVTLGANIIIQVTDIYKQ